MRERKKEREGERERGNGGNRKSEAILKFDMIVGARRRKKLGPRRETYSKEGLIIYIYIYIYIYRYIDIYII